MYKTVFLDWNGTISASKFWWHLEKSKTKDDKKVFKEIESSLFGKFRELLKPWMIGELKTEDILKKISKDTKIEYRKIFDEFLRSCSTMEYTSDDLLTLVSRLRKKGTKVVIATDNMDSFSRWTYPKLKLYNHFDGYLNSYEIGAMKGHTDKTGKSMFFGDYLKSSGLKEGESLIVDDSEDRDGIISSFGIHYMKITPVSGLRPALLKLLSAYK